MSISCRSDIPSKADYFNLFQTTGWNANGAWNADILYEAIKNSWYIVTLYDNEKLVASGRLVSDGYIQCFICEMIVSPEYQNRGIGKRIMNELLDHCKNNGIRWVQLACAKGKKEFYEKFGFQSRASDAPGMNLFL
ncbi:GNAT family N-acetyltransferase [Paenibacillus qinlingensis]|uniref:GNAT family N-acetyltransferase n=1 Tax=Paenibacillus qinlingensis TaxID=1837343 RepID=UPI0015632884|nr:GNAT family N-acetyltransferase [Paenibacillus qinlingensis]NQX62719.1 GNAT family N-acetyltransferase [Paenibacillus qinlingensis]